MPRLAAEEELTARAVSVHGWLEARTQREIVDRLAKVAGISEPVRKPTRADLGKLGIKDVTERS